MTVYRDDDINFLTNVDELAAFHAAFERRHLPHTLALEADLMERNHAVNNWLKAKRLFDLHVHGWTHRDYSKCTEDEVYRDLVQSVEFIVWKFAVKPRYFYPPWNIDSQDARRAAARAGLIFDNRRVEARDYLAGRRDAPTTTVNLHYWQDLGLIDQLLDIEFKGNSPYRNAFHALLDQVCPRLPIGSRVLFVGATDVHAYDRYFAQCEFVSLDIDPGTRPTLVGDIQAPPALEPFDAVVLFGVYEMLTQPERAIAACERLTAPGGWLVLGAPTGGDHWGPHLYTGAPEALCAFPAEHLEIIEGNYVLGSFRSP